MYRTDLVCNDHKQITEKNLCFDSDCRFASFRISAFIIVLGVFSVNGYKYGGKTCKPLNDILQDNLSSHSS